jgi:hypothetical protein
MVPSNRTDGLYLSMEVHIFFFINNSSVIGVVSSNSYVVVTLPTEYGNVLHCFNPTLSINGQ